nr:efflux transporter outer membrane subunit [Fundidesulfovibrio agrisoli]
MLCGCVSVGPDYSRPRLDTPPAWHAAQPQPAQNSQGFEQAAWWRTFGDPRLDGLMRRAVAANQDVAQARARVLQARAEAAVVRAGAFPALDAGAATTTSYSDQNALSSTPLENAAPATPATTYQAGLSVSWELDVFGGQRRSREAAYADAQASEEALRGVTLGLLADVASAYVQLRSAQQRLAIARDAARSQQDNLVVTLERFRIGLTSHLDVSQAQAQRANTQADIPTLETEARQSIHRLGVLTGQEPGALLVELGQAEPLPRPEAAFSPGLPSELLARRPDLRKAERQLASASAGIGVATAKLYPSFDLTMGLGLQGNVLTKFAGLANWYWSIIPSVAAPVFDAGKNRAGVDKQKAVYDEAMAAYRQTLLTALEEVENSLTAFAKEQERRASLAEAVRAGEEALALARERYTKGLTSFLDVLSAEKSLYDTQKSLCASEAGLLQDMISLYKALGGGWDSPALRASS